MSRRLAEPISTAGIYAGGQSTSLLLPVRNDSKAHQRQNNLLYPLGRAQRDRFASLQASFRGLFRFVDRRAIAEAAIAVTPIPLRRLATSSWRAPIRLSEQEINSYQVLKVSLPYSLGR